MRNRILGVIAALAFAFSLSVAAQQPAAVKITNGPVVEGVGDTWAVIAWTTNTGGSTVVRFGTDQNNLSQTAQAPYADNEKTQAQGQNHRVRVTNLQPNTTYFFIVDSGQGEGTGTEAKSQISQFKTKAK